MNDELKRIRDEGAGIYECDVQHPERKFDENGYKYRDFQAGFDFALTKLQHVPEVMAMREALALIAYEYDNRIPIGRTLQDALEAFDKLVGRVE